MLCEPFAKADLHPFLQLAAEEGWVCDSNEFRFIFEQYPQGSFVARSCDGKALGFITSLAHNKSGWIGNLIVRSDQRRNGIGSMLMERCLDVLTASGISTVWLTASSSGAPLYERLGFSQIDRIIRWRMEGSIWRETFTNSAESGIVELLRMDRNGWGDDRSAVCRDKVRQGRLLSIQGSSMVVQKLDSGALIGPWGAYAPEQARQMLRSALQAGVEHGATFIDQPERNSFGAQLLESSGFTCCGKTLLMYRGVLPEYRPETVYALASAGSIG